MEFLIVLIGLGGEGAASYFGDVAEALRRLRGGGTQAMAELEHELAVAEIAALALIADGEVTEEERHTLEIVTTKQDVNGSDVLAAVERLATVAATEEGLRGRLTVLAAQLDAKRRGDAFALVCALARGGSRLRVETGYRGDAHGTPEALVELFAEALSIPPEERPALAGRYAAS